MCPAGAGSSIVDILALHRRRRQHVPGPICLGREDLRSSGAALVLQRPRPAKTQCAVEEGNDTARSIVARQMRVANPEAHGAIPIVRCVNTVAFLCMSMKGFAPVGEEPILVRRHDAFARASDAILAMLHRRLLSFSRRRPRRKKSRPGVKFLSSGVAIREDGRRPLAIRGRDGDKHCGASALDIAKRPDVRF